MMKPVFCPKCHKKITPPPFLQKVKTAGGRVIKLKCGDPKCKGVAKYNLPINTTNDENI